MPSLSSGRAGGWGSRPALPLCAGHACLLGLSPALQDGKSKEAPHGQPFLPWGAACCQEWPDRSPSFLSAKRDKLSWERPCRTPGHTTT